MLANAMSSSARSSLQRFFVHSDAFGGPVPGRGNILSLVRHCRVNLVDEFYVGCKQQRTYNTDGRVDALMDVLLQL